MKKFLFILISLIFLTGCFNPTSVRVVEDMYNKAILEEDEVVAQFFSDEVLAQYSPDELTEELASHARNVGGIPLLNAMELTRNRLNPKIVEELDATYDNWYFIVNDASEEEVMTWVLIKTATQYEVVTGEKLSNTEFQKNILK